MAGRSGVPISLRARDLILLHHVKKDSRPHSASYSVGARVFEELSGQGLMLTTHFLCSAEVKNE